MFNWLFGNKSRKHAEEPTQSPTQVDESRSEAASEPVQAPAVSDSTSPMNGLTASFQSAPKQASRLGARAMGASNVWNWDN